jgi:iron complex transport system ATP-binding protein
MAKSETGEVLYGGKSIKNMKEAEMATVRAVLSQNIEVAFPLKVHEIVMMGRYPHFNQAPAKNDREICREAMHLFDIGELRDRNYMTLSGGEKQRVHFARVCAQIWDTGQAACRYLLLDEPLTFLDIHYQIDLMEKLKLMLRNRQLVVAGVLHDLNLAIKYADNIVLLNEGKILAQGTREKVLTKQNIKTAFRIEPEILTDELREIFYLLF